MKVMLILPVLAAMALAVDAGVEPMTLTKSTTTSSTQTSIEDGASTTIDYSEEDQKRCIDIIGMYVNDTYTGINVTYDVAKVLEKYGGPPGKLNVTWTEQEDPPVREEDKEKRPLPDADDKHWLYRCGISDGKTYLRTEHAVHRFSGTPKAFLEVRGEIYFYPEDFCGKARRAYYTVDDRGFTFELTREYCWISRTTVSCAFPPSCISNDDGHPTSCIASPWNALFDSLIGKGCK